ncbi:MAG: hypothetical protein ACI35O_03905 [Bacillaceae bacterium]
MSINVHVHTRQKHVYILENVGNTFPDFVKTLFESKVLTLPDKAVPISEITLVELK